MSASLCIDAKKNVTETCRILSTKIKSKLSNLNLHNKLQNH
jgi:hypothetical protein